MRKHLQPKAGLLVFGIHFIIIGQTKPSIMNGLISKTYFSIINLLRYLKIEKRMIERVRKEKRNKERGRKIKCYH